MDINLEQTYRNSPVCEGSGLRTGRRRNQSWISGRNKSFFLLQRPKRFWNQPSVLLQLMKLWHAYPRGLLREFIWHLAFTGCPMILFSFAWRFSIIKIIWI